MERIYGKIYNKKRLAPGGVTGVEPTRILHNCTTLGGNSGSVVIDLDSGEALGLHFSGSFLDDELRGARRRREASCSTMFAAARVRRRDAQRPAPAARPVAVAAAAARQADHG